MEKAGLSPTRKTRYSGTQDSIAEETDVTRETVNRYLKELESRGLLVTKRGELIFPTLKNLMRQTRT